MNELFIASPIDGTRLELTERELCELIRQGDSGFWNHPAGSGSGSLLNLDPDGVVLGSLDITCDRSGRFHICFCGHDDRGCDRIWYARHGDDWVNFVALNYAGEQMTVPEALLIPRELDCEAALAFMRTADMSDRVEWINAVDVPEHVKERW